MISSRKSSGYRVGQIGAFFRVPLGYTQLYAVCTQVGADAAPPNLEHANHGNALETATTERLSGYRWMTVALFGESIGAQFERGVGQYPSHLTQRLFGAMLQRIWALPVPTG